MKRDRLIWGLSCLYILTGISFFYYSNLMREKEQNLFTAMHKQNNDLYNLQITYLESSIISQYVIPPDSFLNRGEFVLVFPDNPCDACNQWIFRQLKSLKGTIKIQGIAPSKVKREVIVFNELYDLYLGNIKSSDDFMLPDMEKNDYNEYIYLFYYSKDGKLLYPLLLNNPAINLKFYFDVILMLHPDFS